MYISLLANLGKHEVAMNLRDGLLASRIVTDAHEQHVILVRLKEPASVENSSVSSKR